MQKKNKSKAGKEIKFMPLTKMEKNLTSVTLNPHTRVAQKITDQR